MRAERSPRLFHTLRPERASLGCLLQLIDHGLVIDTFLIVSEKDGQREKTQVGRLDNRLHDWRLFRFDDEQLLAPRHADVHLCQQASIGKDVLLVDVRLPMEYRLGHEPGSLNLPIAQLRKQAPSLNHATLYAVLPEGGVRSELAVHLLNQLGFEAYLLTELPGQPPLAA